MSYNFAPLLEAFRVLATLQKTKLQISPKTTNQRKNLGRFIEAEHAVILFEMIKNVKAHFKALALLGQCNKTFGNIILTA